VQLIGKRRESVRAQARVFKRGDAMVEGMRRCRGCDGALRLYRHAVEDV